MELMQHLAPQGSSGERDLGCAAETIFLCLLIQLFFFLLIPFVLHILCSALSEVLLAAS